VLAVDLEQFCLDILVDCRVRDDVAHHVAEGLVQASLRGVDSHGVRLLPHYLRAVEAGRINPNPNYRFELKAHAVGCLDADHTFGHAAGAEAMAHAIKLAHNSGMGAVSVSNSSHFGSAAYFSLMAAEEDMIGLSFTHADSLMLTYGGVRPYLGTNPICFAAPSSREGPFCLDTATTLVTWNQLLQAREVGNPLDPGCGADINGNETTNADQVEALLPIGGYKGFGLGMMVEVLCSLLTGMPFGRHISRMYADPIEEKRRLGHFFIAMHIASFVDLDLFKASMQRMMDEVRAEPRYREDQPVQVPGDPEKYARAGRVASGIPLSGATLTDLRDLAQKHQLGFPPAISEI
jgi:ureidoglycolate dehydrogenase (NAD+)